MAGNRKCVAFCFFTGMLIHVHTRAAASHDVDVVISSYLSVYLYETW